MIARLIYVAIGITLTVLLLCIISEHGPSSQDPQFLPFVSKLRSTQPIVQFNRVISLWDSAKILIFQAPYVDRRTAVCVFDEASPQLAIERNVCRDFPLSSFHFDVLH